MDKMTVSEFFELSRAFCESRFCCECNQRNGKFCHCTTFDGYSKENVQEFVDYLRKHKSDFTR